MLDGSQPGSITAEGDQPARDAARVAEPAPGDGVSRGRVTAASALLLLAVLAATHFLVDTVAGTVNPLWPRLEQHLSLDKGGILWVYVAWTVSTSFSQLLFGAWADRGRARWLIWAGPAVAIVSLSCIGFATSTAAMGMLFVAGGLGIAAFHPEAAATAGALLPRHRSRAMAVFALCGYHGQAVGPTYSGFVTDRLGLTGLVWGVAWAGAVLVLLSLVLARAPAPAPPPARADSARGRAVPVGLLILLLAIGALRILPALGTPLVLAYLLDARGSSGAITGAVQSAFMVGIGLGAMACAALISPRRERLVIWLMPLCSVPALASLTLLTGWPLVIMVSVCGFLLGLTMPVFISYGQQLLPHGQRVASSITMGVSWGVAGALVAAAFGVCSNADMLNAMFVFFCGAAALSSLLCFWLPRGDDDGMIG